MQQIRWKELQQAQEIHDQRYHRDIYSLPLQRRITHLVLHQAKYVGKAAEAMREETTSLDHLMSLVTDTAIISLSAANALALSLDGKIQCPDIFPSGLVDKYHEFAYDLSIPTGRMAKALEAMDHLELVPYRQLLEEGVIGSCTKAWEISRGLEYNLAKQIQNRWDQIGAKNILK